MNFNSDTTDPFLILLLTIGVVGILVIFRAWRRKMKRLQGVAHSGRSSVKGAAREKPPLDNQRFTPLSKPFGAWHDLGRVLILMASIVVMAGIILVALPQSSVDAMVGRLEARHGVTEQRKIALLYLGDEFVDGTYRIRGVIRNIATEPLGQMDAIVRLYDRNRTLLEVVIVRLDKDTLVPNDFARLNLTIPKNEDSFAGYAVEFKLREGDTIHYQDLRDANRPEDAQKSDP